jgi:hypothetical protein
MLQQQQRNHHFRLTFFSKMNIETALSRFDLRQSSTVYDFIFRKALWKKNQRAEKAKKEGRLPGLNGRPGLTDFESEKIIIDKIIVDANKGVFHDISWLAEIVCSYFLWRI